MVVQSGNLVARCSAPFVRFYKFRPLLLRLATFTAALLVLDSLLFFMAIPFFVFPLAFAVGLLSGVVYINIVASIMDDQGQDSSADREINLGMVGSGRLQDGSSGA